MKTKIRYDIKMYNANAPAPAVTHPTHPTHPSGWGVGIAGQQQPAWACLVLAPVLHELETIDTDTGCCLQPVAQDFVVDGRVGQGATASGGDFEERVLEVGIRCGAVHQ